MPEQPSMRLPYMRTTILISGFVFCAAIASTARAQVAESAEEAQQLLIPLLQTGRIPFMIGNDLSQRDTYGLVASVPGVATSYTKKFMRGWSQNNTYQRPVYAHFNFVNFGRLKDGKYDNCSTSLENVEVTGARGENLDFRFPAHGLMREEQYGEDVKWEYRLESDPRTRFGGPYRVDWGMATFERSNKVRNGWTDFLIKTDQRVPYAQISVQGEDLADYVENAIRVLQLSCRS